MDQYIIDNGSVWSRIWNCCCKKHCRYRDIKRTDELLIHHNGSNSTSGDNRFWYFLIELYYGNYENMAGTLPTKALDISNKFRYFGRTDICVSRDFWRLICFERACESLVSISLRCQWKVIKYVKNVANANNQNFYVGISIKEWFNIVAFKKSSGRAT